MEGFAVLLGIIALVVVAIIPILAIVALVKASHAQQEVERLRGDLAAAERRWLKMHLEKAVTSAHVPLPAPAVVPAKPVELPPSAAVMPPPAAQSQELASAFQAAVAAAAVRHEPVATALTPLRAEEPTPSKPKISLEEMIGANLFIWIGAIALVLTAVFGLKYSVEQNWVSPWVRVASAGVFGLALLGAAEWMRKKSERIGQGLSGAGVLALYGTILAAVRLYHLVPPAAGFGAMVAVTAGAVALSLRHGAPTAVMALLGGMVMPMLLSDGGGHTGPLVAYLLVLQVGVIAVARKRDWSWLPVLTMGGSLVWQAILAFTSDDPTQRFFAAMLTLGSAATLIVIGAKSGQASDGKAGPLRLSFVAVGAAVGFLGILSHRGQHDPMSLGLLGLASLGLLVLTWKDARYRGLLPVAAGVGAITLGTWMGGIDLVDLEKQTLLRTHGDLFIAGAVFAGLWGVGGLLLARCCAVLRKIAVALGIIAPVLTLLLFVAKGDILMERITGPFSILDAVWKDWGQFPEHSVRMSHCFWSLTALLLSFFFTACSFVIAPREQATRLATQAYALPAACLAAFAVVLGIPHPWEGAGLAGVAVVLALFFTRYPLPVLPILAAIVAVLAPLVLGLRGDWELPAPGGPLFGMALGYWGVPTFLAALAMWIFWSRERLEGEEPSPAATGWQAWATQGTSALAVAATVLACAGFLLGVPHPWEATGWAAVAVVLAFAAVALKMPILPILGAGVAVLATCALALRGIWNSPLPGWQLALAYLLPAGLLSLAAWKVRQAQTQPVARLFAALTTVSLSAGILFFTLQAQQGTAFAAPDLDTWVLLVAGQGAFAAVLHWTGRRILHSDTVAAHAPFVAGFAGLLWLAGCGLLANPLWSHEALGSWPVLNLLLPAYGLPAVGLLWSARFNLPDKVRHVFGVAGLVSAMLFVSLAVRHVFHRNDIRLSVDFTQAEHYTLSAAWAVLGAVLLALGIVFKRPLLRYGALIVLVIASAKGFLFDARNLEGLLRVGSFLGLGVTLMGLGFVWQKWVFGGRKK